MSICHNKHYEREFVNMMNQKGHLCMRIAGSGAGTEAVCDTVLFANGKSHLVEVKATRGLVLYVRKHIREQLNKLCTVATANNLIPLLAVKFKHKGWKLFSINYDSNEKLSFLGGNKNECSTLL